MVDVRSRALLSPGNTSLSFLFRKELGTDCPRRGDWGRVYLTRVDLQRPSHLNPSTCLRMKGGVKDIVPNSKGLNRSDKHHLSGSTGRLSRKRSKKEMHVECN